MTTKNQPPTLRERAEDFIDWIGRDDPTLVDIETELREMLEAVQREERELCYRDMLETREIEKPCKKCQGYGVRAYGSTTTWRGGAGGQMVTNGICDNCWGSGDEVTKWINLRRVVVREEP